MKLREFCNQFGDLSDGAFLANFKHPFLLEEGRLALEEGDPNDRSIFHIRTAEQPTKIGRSKSADIRINHEQISNRHAVLWPPISGDWLWFIMDMNSTNGTFVDGEKITPGSRVALNNGMVIRFGLEVRMAFLAPAEILKVVRKQQALGRDRSGHTPGAIRDWDPLSTTTDHKIPRAVIDEARVTAAAERAESDGARMVLTCDPFDPVPIELGRPIVVGRSPKTAQLVLPDPQVSREHCEIVRRPEGVFVRDLGSANGTFVCQVRVGEQPMELLPGKAMTIGPFKIVLEVPGITGSDLGATQVVQPDRAGSGDVQGRIEEVPLDELFQDIETSQRTGVLTIQAGTIEGRVAFKSGQPLNARTSGGETDVPAILSLLRLKAGRFRLSSDELTLGDRSIKMSIGEILLDGFLREQA